MMKAMLAHRKARVLVLGVLMMLFLLPGRAQALVEPFDPTLIITDEEFNDAYAMSCDQIQSFLSERSGVLKGYYDGDKSAAQHICEQANRYSINPRLLLVLIQKEQALLSDNSPSDYALNWAAGCGPGWDSTRGFGTQMECVARTLRKRFDTSSLGTAVDGVVPVNRGTLALYRYTSHVWGNQDFWKIWTRYFPNSSAGPPPTEIVVDSRFIETKPALKDDCRKGWVVGARGSGGHQFATPNVASNAESTNSAIWRPRIPRAGVYQVSVFIPNRDPLYWGCGGDSPTWDTSHARYTVKHRDGETVYEVDQAPLHDDWVVVGAYYFNPGSDGYVKLTDVTGEPTSSRYVSFDEVKFVYMGE